MERKNQTVVFRMSNV